MWLVKPGDPALPSQPKKKRSPLLTVETIEQLVGLVDLAGITLHEERARLVRMSEEEAERLDLPLYDNSLGVSKEPSQIDFRFRMVYTDRHAEYVSDLSTSYVLSQSSIVSEELILEFAARVAFMAAYPFMRASIFASAARLAQPAPILGLVRQGEFSMIREMEDDEVQEAFLDDRSERHGLDDGNLIPSS
jgi:hypothetical protein